MKLNTGANVSRERLLLLYWLSELCFGGWRRRKVHARFWKSSCGLCWLYGNSLNWKCVSSFSLKGEWKIINHQILAAILKMDRRSVSVNTWTFFKLIYRRKEEEVRESSFRHIYKTHDSAEKWIRTHRAVDFLWICCSWLWLICKSLWEIIHNKSYAYWI